MTSKLLALFMSLTGFISSFAQSSRSILVDGTSREYIIHLPASYSPASALPVVFIFHGGGGTAAQIQRHIGMDAIADREQFITVYPQGINKQWNDGREFKQAIAENNDVLFIQQLIDTIQQHYRINSKKIFATGISNGGFFSLYLAYTLSDRFLAVAPVCATIPLKLEEEFYPARPISLLLMNGTNDPLVPYEGGTVGNRFTGPRGDCISTQKTIERFIAVDKTSLTPEETAIPDKNKTDGCRATQFTYNGGAGGSKVVLLKITGGGHTLPGASQYLPKLLIGKVCKDFKGNELIWKFFSQCPVRE